MLVRRAGALCVALRSDGSADPVSFAFASNKDGDQVQWNEGRRDIVTFTKKLRQAFDDCLNLIIPDLFVGVRKGVDGLKLNLLRVLVYVSV